MEPGSSQPITGPPQHHGGPHPIPLGHPAVHQVVPRMLEAVDVSVSVVKREHKHARGIERDIQPVAGPVWTGGFSESRRVMRSGMKETGSMYNIPITRPQARPRGLALIRRDNHVNCPTKCHKHMSSAFLVDPERLYLRPGFRHQRPALVVSACYSGAPLSTAVEASSRATCKIFPRLFQPLY